jgi:hypothetical protein
MKKSFILCALLFILQCGMPELYPEEKTSVLPAGGIFIYPKTMTVREKATSVFSVYVINGDGTRRALADDEVTLSCSSGDVSISGLSVTAVTSGIIEITAEYCGMSDSASITIRPLPNYLKLKISEVMYDPLEETAGEYIEIFNSGSRECDLAGVLLSNGDAGCTKYIFGNISINPGKYIVIGNSETSFQKAYSCSANYYGLPFTLRNTADAILLIEPDGKIVDAVYIKKGTADYPAPPPWGTLSSGDQKSLNRKNPYVDNDLPTDFIASTPTPGK